MPSHRLPMRLLAGALALAAGLVASAGAADSAPEYQLKAAYLYNFAKFTEWPAGTLGGAGPVTLCVAGRDPFGDALTGLETKTVQSRPVRVRRNVRPDDVRGCQIVFVTEGDDRRMQEMVHAAEVAAALTVSDVDGFVDQGGMIGLATRDNRILFDVNLDAAHRAGLRMSSQMLKLARTVRGRP